MSYLLLICQLCWLIYVCYVESGSENEGLLPPLLFHKGAFEFSGFYAPYGFEF